MRRVEGRCRAWLRRARRARRLFLKLSLCSPRMAAQSGSLGYRGARLPLLTHTSAGAVQDGFPVSAHAEGGRGRQRGKEREGKERAVAGAARPALCGGKRRPEVVPPSRQGSCPLLSRVGGFNAPLGFYSNVFIGISSVGK